MTNPGRPGRRPTRGRPAGARAPRRGAACCAVALAAAAAGCDPPPAGEILLGPPPAAGFAVADVNVRDARLASGEDLVVRFTRPVDAASAGPRSVVVTSPRHRRLSGAAAVVRGDTVTVPARALAALADDGTLELRIEGGASPCAVRAEDGDPLPARATLRFRVGSPPAADLDGPVLTATRPADGSAAVSPGAAVELRFDEPVVAGTDAVTLRIDGADAPAAVRASRDRRRVFVRPRRPFPSGARVDVAVHRCVTDDAGNPLAAASPRAVSFRVRESPAREIEEDFAGDDFADGDATNCAWGGPGAPGLLVARRGPTAVPLGGDEPAGEFGDLAEVRFQVLLPRSDVGRGVASSLRLRFARAGEAAPVRTARVEIGPAAAWELGPTFDGNRGAARLVLAADAECAPDWIPDGAGGAEVEIAFDRPVALDGVRAVLLDVTLALEPGARLAGTPDADGRALVRRGGRERLVPAGALLVTGTDPVAQSRWYDSGADAPSWLPAVVETRDGAPSAVRAEFQTAPAGPGGGPDPLFTSDWAPDLGAVPPWRFVRFRVRWDPAAEAEWPAVDRVALPFE